MKKSLKSTLAVAVMSVSVTLGFVFYSQIQNRQLAFANPLMEENIEALADVNGYVPNGMVEIVESITKCHKLVKDLNQSQGEGDEKVYWHYDLQKNAANCKLIEVKNYKSQRLCESWMLKNCSQYGGTPHEIPADYLGWY